MVTESELQAQAIKAAAKSANAPRRTVPKEIELSNGVVLEVRPMPPMLLNSVANSIPEPEVPEVWIEDKGRSEPNPNHPDYLRAMEERQAALSLATINLILYACTKVVHIPEGVYHPEDEEWRAWARMAKVSFDPDDSAETYLAWLRCYAISTVNDMNQTQTIPLLLAGVSEEEVDEAIDSFRRGEEWSADSGAPAESGGEDGDFVQDDNPRPRRRARGEGS